MSRKSVEYMGGKIIGKTLGGGTGEMRARNSRNDVWKRIDREFDIVIEDVEEIDA